MRPLATIPDGCGCTTIVETAVGLWELWATEGYAVWHARGWPLGVPVRVGRA